MPGGAIRSAAVHVLTRAEASERADLLTVRGYDLALDLRMGAETDALLADPDLASSLRRILLECRADLLMARRTREVDRAEGRRR